MGVLTVLWSLFSLWDATLLGFSLIVFVLLWDYVAYRRRGAAYPPGPYALPFVGNMFLLDFNKLPDSLSKLSKKYGSVFSLQLFWHNVVVVNGYEAVKEALVTKSEDTADRPSIPLYEHLGFDNGIAMSKYSQHWKEKRRFTLHTLKNFGMGKKSIEERVKEEARYLCSAFQAEEGHPFDPYLLINNAVSNVICSIVFGDRFDYSDQKFQRMLKLSRKLLELETGFLPQIFNIFPWLMKIPGPHQKVFEVQTDCLNFIREIIKDHKDTWDPAVQRDFIDAFHEEIENSKGDDHSSFNETSLLFTSNDLFGAGTETTSMTLRWSILMMLLHPDIQRLVHEEIDREIGCDRVPTMEDQLKMSFTNAVIHETQRYGNILPISIAHMTYKDTKLQGFTIPKGTQIIPNMTSVLKDETIWEKPYQFYPGHFLDPKGNFVKREAFIPFSAGRRACLGEPLARMELFILFTSLLQHFVFKIPCKQPRPRDEPIYMFGFLPPPFQMCAELR